MHFSAGLFQAGSERTPDYNRRSRYNPGDTVRLLALDYSTELGLVPNDKFILEIVDSRQNIINKKEISFENSLLIHEFKLADKANNGLWTLRFEE